MNLYLGKITGTGFQHAVYINADTLVEAAECLNDMWGLGGAEQVVIPADDATEDDHALAQKMADAGDY